MSDSATPWTVAYQTLPSMEFSRQEEFGFFISFYFLFLYLHRLEIWTSGRPGIVKVVLLERDELASAIC